MFKDLGVPELLIILVIVLVLFGAGRIPEVGASLGKGIRNFKRAMSEDDEEKAKEHKPSETPTDVGTPPTTKA
jgi:sec-independent protein translocase protein TatA